MQNKVVLIKMTCPTCKTEYLQLVGDNEDGNFYCQAQLDETVTKGDKSVTTTVSCGESISKWWHADDWGIQKLGTFTAQDILKFKEATSD